MRQVRAGLVPLLFAVTACLSQATSPTLPEAPPPPGSSTPPAGLTAVLPFANETNTVDAPDILRNFMADELVRRGFKLQPLEDTAARLRDQLQISDGGQLPSVDSAQIGEALGGVGTLFYGDVLEWKKLTMGIYNTVAITVRFKLVDAASGTVRWERTHEVRKKIDMNISNNILAEILAGAAVNLLLNPMTPYARQLAREVGRQLPQAPEGAPTAGIPPGDNPQGEFR